ncbi:MAG: hypothetical protein ACI9RO_001764 [Alteromonas macleodii]|jgi:hypothetical protein
MLRILTFSLALLIASTSQQMAMARGIAKDAQGQVILCSAQGPLVVTLNEQDNPIGPVTICPDCALTLMACSSATVIVKPLLSQIQTILQTPVLKSEILVIPTSVQARGPPLVV